MSTSILHLFFFTCFLLLKMHYLDHILECPIGPSLKVVQLRRLFDWTNMAAALPQVFGAASHPCFEVSGVWVRTKDSGREGPACRVISCRMERGMNYCVYAHLRQLIAISRHFWSVLKRLRHAASESHADMTDAAEFNMIVSIFLTRQKAKTKQSKAKENKSNTNKTKHL